MKEVAHRQLRGGGSGVSFRIAKGMRFHTGTFRARSVVVRTSLEEADRGRLTITSLRTVFSGQRKTLDLPHSKLVNLNVYTDGISFNLSNPSRNSSSSSETASPAARSSATPTTDGAWRWFLCCDSRRQHSDAARLLGLPGRGMYILSLAPRAGDNFQKAGAIRNRVIAFQDGRDQYEIRTSGPILGSDRAWNLYVEHLPKMEMKGPLFGVDRF